MLEMENWSKERVHQVMLELLYSFNYGWFLMEEWIKEHCPEKMESGDFQAVAEAFGSYQAKRLEKTVDTGASGVDRLIAFLRHSHWSAFEEIELAKLSETELRMRTLNCTAQRAAAKWGMGHYECGEAGLRLRRGFIRQIEPEAQVSRVFTPPQARPEQTPQEASCEWLISLPWAPV